jgi:ribonuclease P protein component
MSIDKYKFSGGMNNLCKAERLHSRMAIEKLFSGGSARSFSLFPLRVVYMPVENCEPSASMLVSVPKKRFKRAVKRNLVKRQVREAFRLNKSLLTEPLAQKDYGMNIAFIYISDEIVPTAEINSKVSTLLSRIAEKLS